MENNDNKPGIKRAAGATWVKAPAAVVAAWVCCRENGSAAEIGCASEGDIAMERLS